MYVIPLVPIRTHRNRQIEEANYVKSVGQHPHCVRYYAAWEEGGYMYIQTELCDRGTYVDVCAVGRVLIAGGLMSSVNISKCIRLLH